MTCVGDSSSNPPVGLPQERQKRCPVKISAPQFWQLRAIDSYENSSVTDSSFAIHRSSFKHLTAAPRNPPDPQNRTTEEVRRAHPAARNRLPPYIVPRTSVRVRQSRSRPLPPMSSIHQRFPRWTSTPSP